jgi:hypothetical protein
MSGATLRSLLDGVGVCEGATCGDLTHRTTIPVTQFTYQEDDPSYDMWHVVRPGQTQPVGPEWRLFFTGDLDGDGIRDRRYRKNDGSEELELSSHCAGPEALNGSWFVDHSAGLGQQYTTNGPSRF